MKTRDVSLIFPSSNPLPSVTQTQISLLCNTRHIATFRAAAETDVILWAKPKPWWWVSIGFFWGLSFFLRAMIKGKWFLIPGLSVKWINRMGMFGEWNSWVDLETGPVNHRDLVKEWNLWSVLGSVGEKALDISFHFLGGNALGEADPLDNSHFEAKKRWKWRWFSRLWL